MEIATAEEIQTGESAPPKRTSRRRALHSSPLVITARPVNEREYVSHFLRIALRPDPNAEMSLRQLNDRYPRWCREQSLDPLPPAQLGQQLRSIIDAIGLECVATEKDVIIRGAALNLIGVGDQNHAQHRQTTHCSRQEARAARISVRRR